MSEPPVNEEARPTVAAEDGPEVAKSADDQLGTSVADLPPGGKVRERLKTLGTITNLLEVTAGTETPTGGELPDWLRDLIGSPPKHGDGVHPWLFKVARQLHAHRDFESIISLLTVASEGCGRHVDDREIRDAVRDAAKVAWKPSGTTRAVISRQAKKWPACDPILRKSTIDSAGITGIADLWHASPVPCSRDSTDAEFFADHLFPGNPLLCVGMDAKKFRTASREEFRGRLSQMALIVPSPMTALTGPCKSDGKISAHTLANTGPRRFLVIESDEGSADEQAAILWHLRRFAPLVLALSSGGKSLHGWFNCQGVSEDITLRFMRYAVSIGADPATWTRSQFVRIPEGWRAEKGTWQDVIYFDPAKLEGGVS